ncbi:alpha/beta hydrolase [Streptomyces chartreusis]|uniref:alpha/beta fold hydrolase n=1 Tax=Streptomyces chartreusis TaxID=1969 RepID=UPI002F907B77|nr:alpha/beta hydrolase [Streptomyces chartreusis]WTA33424.1 alpha/beta hydrolase [Streptomyces chartreusis]
MNRQLRLRRARTPLIVLTTATVATAILTTTVVQASATKENASKPTKPTVVLVHGAFADSSSWNGVIKELNKDGYPVRAAANPLRSLRGDATSLNNLLASIDGPVILVGHSYGGAVISNAAYSSDNVKALVYADAFIPAKGESVADLTNKFPGSVIDETLRPVPITNPDGSEDVDLYIDQAEFRAAFAADVPARTADLMSVTQRPGTGSALNEPSGEPGWKTIPSWALVGTNDRIIPRETQIFMAKRANAHIKEIKSSHAVTVSRPDAVSRIIENAAQAIR